jgi:hypothetical protein
MTKQHPANQLIGILLMAAAHGQTRAAWGIQAGHDLKFGDLPLQLDRDKRKQKNITQFCVKHRLTHYIDTHQKLHLSAGYSLAQIDYTSIVLALMLFEFTEYAQLNKAMRYYQLRYILTYHFDWLFDYTRVKQWAT